MNSVTQHLMLYPRFTFKINNTKMKLSPKERYKMRNPDIKLQLIGLTFICTERMRIFFSLLTLNVNIELDSLWTHLKAMSHSFSLQYKQNPYSENFISFIGSHSDLNHTIPFDLLTSILWTMTTDCNVWKTQFFNVTQIRETETTLYVPFEIQVSKTPYWLCKKVIFCIIYSDIHVCYSCLGRGHRLYSNKKTRWRTLSV